jgi:vitamin B12 transporter
MLLPIIWLALILSTHAQETLETVEVTATKELKDFHLGRSEKIDDPAPFALLGQAIQEAQGVVTSQNGGPGGRVAFFIRGTEARHVLFTLDNLKINDPSNTDRQFDAAFFTSPFLESIVLHKGPQAVLFGSDAMGGVVDMKSRKGEEAPQTRLLLNAGSFGTTDASLSKDWQGKSSRGTLTWSSFRTDGISRLNKKRFRAKERDGTELTQLTSSSNHAWSSKTQSDLLVSFLRGQSELDGFIDDNSNDRSFSDQYLLQQKTSHELSSSSAISLRNGLSRHDRRIKTLAAGDNFYAGDLGQHEFLYEQEKGGLRLLIGAALEEEALAQNHERAHADLRSIFVQTSIKLKEAKVQAGLRYEDHSLFGKYQTGSMGLAYGNFALQWSQGLKAPSLYQLYGLPLFGTPIGNKDLAPEKNNSLEAKWSLDPIMEVALFRNSLSDLITFTNQGYINQARFISQGAELSSNFSTSNLRFRPFFTFQDFKQERNTVLRRPTRSMGLDASWFPFEALELFTKVRFYNERKDLGESGTEVKLNGFETVSVGAKYTIGPSEYGVEVVNLANREYEELYGYSVMPRSVFFHFGRRF